MVLLHSESLLIAVNVKLPDPLSGLSASSQVAHADSLLDALVLLCLSTLLQFLLCLPLDA